MGRSNVTFCWINTYKSGEEDKHGQRWTDTKTHRIRSLLRCDGTGDGAKRRVRERGMVHSTRENFYGDSTTNRIDTLGRFFGRFFGIFYFFNERRSFTTRTLPERVFHGALAVLMGVSKVLNVRWMRANNELSGEIRRAERIYFNIRAPLLSLRPP